MCAVRISSAAAAAAIFTQLNQPMRNSCYLPLDPKHDVTLGSRRRHEAWRCFDGTANSRRVGILPNERRGHGDDGGGAGRGRMLVNIAFDHVAYAHEN